MLALIRKIGSISATIRKVADTIHVGADSFDVLKRLNAIWDPQEPQETQGNLKHLKDEQIKSDKEESKE